MDDDDDDDEQDDVDDDLDDLIDDFKHVSDTDLDSFISQSSINSIAEWSIVDDVKFCFDWDADSVDGFIKLSLNLIASLNGM